MLKVLALTGGGILGLALGFAAYVLGKTALEESYDTAIPTVLVIHLGDAIIVVYGDDLTQLYLVS